MPHWQALQISMRFRLGVAFDIKTKRNTVTVLVIQTFKFRSLEETQL